MPQFDESKLSRILARRIIAPEDRSQFLPMCTPIYCPDNNGVKASQVTIIDPNLNTFYDDVDPTNTRSKYIGSQINSKATSEVIVNSKVISVGSPTISEGVASNFSTSNYLKLSDDSRTLVATQTIAFTTGSDVTTKQTPITDGNSRVTLDMQNGAIALWDTVNSRNVTLLSVQPSTKYYIKVTSEKINGVIETNYYKSNDGVSYDTHLLSVNQTDPTNETFNVTYGVSNPYTDGSPSNVFLGTIDLVNTTRNGVPLATIKSTISVTKQPHEVQNIINIDLNKSVSRDYFVPYEVELKSDADIISVIKSDFAAYFKNRVSNEIYEQLKLLHSTGAISTINKGASLAETFGEVISTFVSQGTGQKYSIYKYNNGAPVVYSMDSNQPNIDKDINQNDGMTYAFKDDINVPALNFIEQPTLILPNTTYTDYQTELCNGNIKDYANKMINVDTATADFSQLGEGVFGTNDTFAVAFSAPSIKLVPDTNFYGYRLCCTMLYGVKLIHKHNVRLLV